MFQNTVVCDINEHCCYCLTADWTTGFRSLAETKDFSSSLCVQISSEAHPAFYPMGTGGPFPGVKREFNFCVTITFLPPALGPTQPPVQWVPGVLSPGVKRGRGVTLTTHSHLVPSS
jgi:hypothetical protein